MTIHSCGDFFKVIYLINGRQKLMMWYLKLEMKSVFTLSPVLPGLPLMPTFPGKPLWEHTEWAATLKHNPTHHSLLKICWGVTYIHANGALRSLASCLSSETLRDNHTHETLSEWLMIKNVYESNNLATDIPVHLVVLDCPEAPLVQVVPYWNIVIITDIHQYNCLLRLHLITFQINISDVTDTEYGWKFTMDPGGPSWPGSPATPCNP